MSDKTTVDVKLDYIQSDIQEIKESLKNNYVKHDEFTPVRNLVYGMVSIILMSVLGALVALVINK